jgi:hypothetical protein
VYGRDRKCYKIYRKRKSGVGEERKRHGAGTNWLDGEEVGAPVTTFESFSLFCPLYPSLPTLSVPLVNPTGHHFHTVIFGRLLCTGCSIIDAIFFIEN